MSLEIENSLGKFCLSHLVQDHVEGVCRLENSDVWKVLEGRIGRWPRHIVVVLHRLRAGEDVVECPAIPDGELHHGVRVQFVDPLNELG